MTTWLIGMEGNKGCSTQPYLFPHRLLLASSLISDIVLAPFSGSVTDHDLEMSKRWWDGHLHQMQAY